MKNETPPNKLLTELCESAQGYGCVLDRGGDYNSPARRRFRKSLRAVKAHLVAVEDKARLLPHERLCPVKEHAPLAGWRILKYGEPLENGDMYWYDGPGQDAGWLASLSALYGQKQQSGGILYSRKLK